MVEKSKEKLNTSEVYQKLTRFCAYQERCHLDVSRKLKELGVWGQEADLILSELINDNYLNEERFAKSFAGGKFRIKKWGRLKIKRELKARQISETCIRMAMKEISESEYKKTILKLIETKSESLSSVNTFQGKAKLATYMMGRGFESELVWEILNKSN